MLFGGAPNWAFDFPWRRWPISRASWSNIASNFSLNNTGPLDPGETAMSRIEIQVKGLFATPVAAVILPDAEARNAELQDIILRRRAAHPSIGASNMGGWHSTRDFAEWGGKRAEEVLAFGRDLATKLTTDRDGKS